MVACRMNEIFHQHIPVLLNEVIASLIHSKNGIYVDATFGRGSHSQAILNSLDATGRLIAFDKDPDAVNYARSHFKADKRFTIIHSSFANMQTHLDGLNVSGKIDGVLFDLGVSSPQLDDPNRGFSFARDGELDMRMDNTQGIDAKTWLKTVDEKELASVLWQYGEEKYSRRIAHAIVTARQESVISTTGKLADIILHAIPKPKKYQDKHPATRSFQAIRIVINAELNELQQGLNQAFDVIKPGGRMAIISFHSLEDRIVKQFIKHHEKGNHKIPRGLPIKHEVFQARLQSIGKPIKPSLHEMNVNPRSRSAILRIAEKLS